MAGGGGNFPFYNFPRAKDAEVAIKFLKFPSLFVHRVIYRVWKTIEKEE